MNPSFKSGRSFEPSFHLGVAFRLAWKGLARSPGTTLLAMTVLTLGLAAPTTFFSLLVGAIRPLPVPEGDRVVRMEVTQSSRGGQSLSLTLQDLRALQPGSTMEALGAYRLFEGVLLDAGRSARRLTGAALTPQVLSLLRVSPALGRIPSSEEGGAALLLSHALWVRAFDGDTEVLGRMVALDGTSRTIVAVMPEGFGFPFNQEAWTVLSEGLEDTEPVEFVGRLAEGASLATAQTELSGLWSQRDGLRDPGRRDGSLQVDGFTGGRGERGEGIAFLGLVMVAMALLLIACSNVANLLLVRATERVRSLAVQSAVGASRLQIGAQLFLEALLVAALGGVGGVLVAWLAVDAIETGLSAEHFGYFWMRMAVDGRVLLFLSILVVGTALVAGLLPVIRVLKADLQEVLKEETAGVSVGGGGAWSRGFVTAQLALSCGALVAAGLTGVSMAQSAAFGEGVPGEETIMASLSVETSDWEVRISSLEEAISSAAKAEASALALAAPGFMEPWGSLELDGVALLRDQDRQGVLWNAVTPGYFEIFDMTLRAGRYLSPGDGSGAAPVAVVNESFVERHFPSGDPVGRRVRISASDADSWYVVVGVVSDLDLGGGPHQRRERIYLSLLQNPSPKIMTLVRASGNPRETMSDLRERLARMDPGMPVVAVRTLAEAYAYLIRVPRAMASMAFAGGMAALLVAAVGLYGLLSFRVRQRRRELGLRMALGADGLRLAREVFSLAIRQLAPAVVVGLTLAWVLAPLIAVVLLGGDPRSPAVYAGVAVCFLAVGLGAALFPALRAAALDPAEALRGS